ncbi:hypothetical protein GCM10009651_29910 [Microbacterium natoriense]
MRSKIGGFVAAVALAAGAFVLTGPVGPAAAATCDVTGSYTGTTSSYARTGGTCSQARAFISRLNSSTGVVSTYYGSWRASGYSTVSASNGYPYNGGFQIR